MTDKRLNMDLDSELLKKAHAQAIMEGKQFKQWVAEAIKEKLERSK